MTARESAPADHYDENGDHCGEPLAGPEEHYGQLRMALRLAGRYEHKLLFVHGIGWHHYDGKRWAEDDEGHAGRAVQRVISAAIRASVNDPELGKDARRCQSAAGVKGVLELAQVMTQFAATVRGLDPDPYLLNVANGTLDLRDLELRPHDPRDRLTKVCNAAYDPDATGDLWQTFLTRVLPAEDVRGYLQRYVGTALCGTVLEHALAILTGQGRNGKGVFYGMVTKALGDYGQTADPDLFMHREGAHPTGEMDLRGARFVVVSENDKHRKLAEATVKRLTGGDPVKARKMRQDFVQFEPSHTPALVTNHLPKVTGDDPALWARLRVVPFDVVIPKPEQDVQLPEKLTIELDAILTWVIAGWVEYRRRGELDEPEAVLVATGKYHADSDDVAAFLDANVVANPHAHELFAAVWERWQTWRTDNGGDEINKKAFGQSLDTRGFAADVGSKNKAIRRGLMLLAGDSDA